MTASTGLTAALLQDALRQYAPANEVPGAVVALFDGNAVIEAPFGVLSTGSRLPVTTDALFKFGSIGKVMTATLVMQLVDEGLVVTDQPVAEYLPGLTLGNSESSALITVQHLLSHTSGLDGDKFEDFGRGDDCIGRYVGSLADLEQLAPPGTIWSYCNAGFVVLGRLVEVVRGKPYDEVLKERIFGPAGMADSVYFADEAILHSVALGHLPAAPGETPSVAPFWNEFGRCLGPAGSMAVGTARDLLAFGRVHLSRGAGIGGSRVLSARSVAAMHESRAIVPDRALLGDAWGLGWSLRTQAGPLVIGHDGNTTGQTAFLRLVPETGCVVALVTNANNGPAIGLFHDLCASIIDAATGMVTLKSPSPVPDAEVDLGLIEGTYRRLGVDTRIQAGMDGVLLTMFDTEGGPASDDRAMTLPIEPVDARTWVMPIPGGGGTATVAFIGETDGGKAEFIHMGARAARRLRS